MQNKHVKSGYYSNRPCECGSLQSARVLVADDNLTNLHVVKGLLSLYKIEADLAMSGRECLSKMKETDYQLIFMDYSMPEMDGMETFLEIRRIQELKSNKTPVIALTANESEDVKGLFLQAGFCEFIQKPVSIIKLDRVLETCLPELRNQRNMDLDRWDEKQNWMTSISGIHIQEGMQNYGNDQEQYLNILNYFYEDSQAHINRMKRLLDQKDHSLFLFEIHALKGLAAGIGAQELSSMAGDLEQAVKEDNKNVVEEKAPLLLEYYAQIRIEIEGILFKLGRLEHDTDGNGEIDRDKLLEMVLFIMEKISFLEQNLAEVAMKNLLSYSISDNLRRMLNCVKSALDEFEYEEANDMLKKIVEEMKSEIGANNE